jgi:hypothetical protein
MIMICVNFNHLIGRCCTIQLCPKSPWVYFLSFAYAYQFNYLLGLKHPQVGAACPVQMSYQT